MAKRVFFIIKNNRLIEEEIEFKYFNGFSITQKQKSIIASKNNPGKIVINLTSNDLKKDYERLKINRIGKNLTEIRYINTRNPYYYFSLKDPDDNIIEVTGRFDSNFL